VPKPIRSERIGPQIVRDNDSDTLCTFGESNTTLLPFTECEAVCTSIDEKYFAPWKRTKFVFTFEIMQPMHYAKTKLEMFVRIDAKWKGQPPRAATLWKAAAVALGRHPNKVRVTKSMFIGGLFRCKLAHVGDGAAAYTKVKAITERMA
jgi:hypothetical protein